MSFLPTYGTTLGPIGIPMADEQAFALDAIFKQLPAEDQRVRKAAIPSALLNLAAGKRSDISWITTESIDRDKEIVLASGLRRVPLALPIDSGPCNDLFLQWTTDRNGAMDLVSADPSGFFRNFFFLKRRVTDWPEESAGRRSLAPRSAHGDRCFMGQQIGVARRQLQRF